MVATGFGALALAWRGTARVVEVGLQFPQVVSGGLGGLGLVLTGLLVLSVQGSRVASARERQAMGRLADRTITLAATVAGRRGNGQKQD